MTMIYSTDIVICRHSAEQSTHLKEAGIPMGANGLWTACVVATFPIDQHVAALIVRAHAEPIFASGRVTLREPEPLSPRPHPRSQNRSPIGWSGAFILTGFRKLPCDPGSAGFTGPKIHFRHCAHGSWPVTAEAG